MARTTRCTFCSILLLVTMVLLLSPLSGCPATTSMTNGGGPCDLGKLIASDGAPFDNLGASISISGNVAVIGAPGTETPASGFANVYRFDGTNWLEEARLAASDNIPFDAFGSSVSISGDAVVIGARIAGLTAYVYRFDGTEWIEEATLTPLDFASSDAVGPPVSVSGDAVVIGTNGDGSAYVYRFDGTNWLEEARLAASDATYGDCFGASVFISGDVAVVGAPSVGLECSPLPGSITSAAYIFRFDGEDWNEEARLTASDTAEGSLFNFFGGSVSIHDDVTLIGAGSEGAYLYRFDGSTWVEESKLIPSDVSGSFGISAVSISGDVAVIGGVLASAVGGDPGSASSAAYVYRFDGTNWIEQAKLTGSDPADGVNSLGESDYFGNSVSVSGDVLVIGAENDGNTGQRFSLDGSGAAYVFSVAPDCPSPTLKSTRRSWTTNGSATSSG